MIPITKMISSYNKSPRNGRKIKAIVIHDVGAVSSAKDNASYFNGGNRNSSADFFVDSNSIYQIIEYKRDYSWAIGDGKGKYGYNNYDTVSIEMCLESNRQPSETTIQNTIDLVKYLMNELGLGVNNVVRHYDCSKKQCPNSFSGDNWAKWNEFKKRIITSQDNNKEEEYEMKNLVVYGNSVDKRASEYLADYLQCPCIDGNIPFDYSKIENVVCVGSINGEWTGYAKKIITGSDRYDTMIQVLKYIGKL